MSKYSFKSRPPISVLMPVRNGQRTVGMAVKSTLAALDVADEFLVYDDGSTDETLNVIRDIGDSRIRVAKGLGRAGVANALNILLADARHELVGRIDADDLSMPWRFAMQARTLADGSAAVFTSRVNFGSHPKTWRQAWPRAIGQAYAPILFVLENPVPHSSLLARKDVLVSAGGYNPGPAEDYELWLRILGMGHGVERLATPGIMYRLHEDQVTKSGGWLQEFAGDERLAKAHSILLDRLGWTGGPLWNDWYQDQTFGAEDDSRGAEFVEFFESLLEEIPVDQRWRQRRLLRRAYSRSGRGVCAGLQRNILRRSR